MDYYQFDRKIKVLSTQIRDLERSIYYLQRTSKEVKKSVDNMEQILGMFENRVNIINESFVGNVAP